ncbi:MAG: CRISPR-associated endonuclease Cas3'', partial [Candidatus Omnitrophica bacterium]|nr:CRISPR-associated endonuclease Cas3'' [Candidatus Omnitrophota bacterium]
MNDYFWAKTTQEGRPGKSVLSHMRDVQAVANILLNGKKGLLSTYGLNREIVSAFAGLHDIGKISPCFQSKCEEWLRQNKLESVARNNAWDTLESDHAKITQYTIQNILQKNKMTAESAELWSALLGAHHGRLNRLGSTPRGCKPDDEWENRREKQAMDFFGSVILPGLAIDDSWPLAWWLAGLVSIADWIGSNEDYFFPDKIETSQDESNRIATAAFKAIGFDNIEIHQNLSFSDIFKDDAGQPFYPNDLQVKAGDRIIKPGLYVIEAPMGMGKTEAALWCSYKLMCEEKASGIYFALPTQATSNRIHIRMQKFLERISKTTVEAKLVHANSWLLDNIR